jgi:hypothetical protein
MASVAYLGRFLTMSLDEAEAEAEADVFVEVFVKASVLDTELAASMLEETKVMAGTVQASLCRGRQGQAVQ